MKEYISRAKYYDRIQPFIGKPVIKVFIGQRRVGKSYLLAQVQDVIEQNGGPCNFIYVDKEDDAFSQIATEADLTEYINSKSRTNAVNYVLVDEIQEIENFENSIRSLAAKPNYDIYITGSNSQLLSGELATRLSGRYVEIQVYSLDFREFILFHDSKNDPDSLQFFLKFGGMPFLRHLELKETIVYEYLKNVFTSILYRDIVARYGIRNVNFLDRLVHFVADNIGNILSAKKISDYLKSQRVNISVNIVLDYLSYLTNSQVIIPVKRMDLKGKHIFELGEKFYFQDLGIRNALAGFRPSDMGKLLENCIFNHLISHGYTVYTGDWQQREIDFVAEKNNERVYIQVAYLLAEPATVEREFGNLALIQDNYPKLVVSLDPSFSNSINGIAHWNIKRFLEDFK